MRQIRGNESSRDARGSDIGEEWRQRHWLEVRCAVSIAIPKFLRIV